jgi:predicted alpha/beta superfamily hydrolase
MRIESKLFRFVALVGVLLCGAAALRGQSYFDRTYDSKVFGEKRHYRIILPPTYRTSGSKRYPVIYYFHGHSDRYTVEAYDQGKDTIPKMVAYAAAHPVIIVCVDGYIAAEYQGFYGGDPWDLRKNGGDHDFGPYFLELVKLIDHSYRTLTDRRHRATSGLSMGGYMSLYLSARYPDLIGSASAFNPGPEFYIGEKGRRILWRPKDHVAQHARTMIRLVRASGDFISQYHEETRDAYARAAEVDFEYRQDEYYKHWATSIAETFDFHQRAFENLKLDQPPERFRYASPYLTFDVWGYRVNAEAPGSGLTYLDDVGKGGMRVLTRRWAVDGPSIAEARITIDTAPLYAPGHAYTLTDYDLLSGVRDVRQLTATTDGRLRFSVNGAGHQLSIEGPGIESAAPVLLPLATSEEMRVESGRDVSLPVRIYNPRSEPISGLTITLSSQYPTVSLLSGSATVSVLEPGQVTDLSSSFRLRFTAGAGYFARTRLELKMAFDPGENSTKNLDVLVTPDAIPAPLAYEILDGRTVTLPVFRQKGNYGGGGAALRTVTEGKGNGNGVLEPGEEATIWVKMAQGLDPFDKGNWHRTRIYSDSPWISEIVRLEEQKGAEYTSAMELTSVIRLSSEAPPGAEIPLILDNESWSFAYTPDVRFGKEPLDIAFQLHEHHLHRLVLRVGK